MSESLASYNEVRWDGKRRFELHADRVSVSGKGGGSTFETMVMLANLRPEPDKLWVRNRVFMLGIVMLLLSFVLFIGTVQSLQQNRQTPGFPIMQPSLAVGLLIVGLAICTQTSAKVEFARFQSNAGIVLLDVARAGPDRRKFQEFVELLVKQIRSNQES